MITMNRESLTSDYHDIQTFGKSSVSVHAAEIKWPLSLRFADANEWLRVAERQAAFAMSGHLSGLALDLQFPMTELQDV